MPQEARKLIASFGAVAQEILRLSGANLKKSDLVAKMSEVILEFARCSAADMFLLEQGRVTRFSATLAGAASAFEVVAPAKHVSAVRPADEVHASNSSSYDTLCCGLLSHRIECETKEFVDGSAFWTARATVPLDMLERNDDAPHRFRFFADYSYPSLAVMPFDLDHANRGLLVLKSGNQDFFTGDSVGLLKEAANLLGMPIVHHRTQVALRERIKELGCLYEIAKLAGVTNTQEDVLAAVANLLPPAWLHPERTSARIVLGDREYRSQDYRNGSHRLRADISVGKESCGFVEVSCVGTDSALDEGPFLEEEKHLIETVARDLSWIVEQSTADQHRRKLQDQLLHADRLATIGQLSAGVAHELNEPLGGILGFAQLSLKAPDLPEQVRRDLDRIVTASLHAREVIRKLLLFARQSGAKKGWVDLNALVTDGLYFLESRCAKAGVQLIRNLASDLPDIQGEPGQIYQVVINLAVNAIQAMPAGGVLTITTTADDAGVRVTVEDTGTGMSQEVKQKLFLPFFTTKDIGEGTGLGLSVVEGIVGSHGGSISVESTEGVGTVFSVYLPRKAASGERAVER